MKEKYKKMGNIWYKCRFCEKKFIGVHTPDAGITLNMLLMGIEHTKWGIVSRQEIHCCSERNTGVGDYIGCSKDLKETK
jgi:hypothetical protein